MKLAGLVRALKSQALPRNQAFCIKRWVHLTLSSRPVYEAHLDLATSPCTL